GDQAEQQVERTLEHVEMHLEPGGRCAKARRLLCLHFVSGHATNLAPEQRRHHLRHTYRGRGSTGRPPMLRRHRRPPHRTTPEPSPRPRRGTSRGGPARTVTYRET